MTDRNWIQGPLDMVAKNVVLNGVPFTLVADLPEGGYVQIVNGDNPLEPAIPGPQILKGCLLLCLQPNIAEQVRGGIRKVEAGQAKALGQPFAIDGHPVAPSSFTKTDPRFSE